MMRILPVAILSACLSCAIIAPMPAAAAAKASASATTGGVTRDQYIEKAVEKARRSAEKRFDQMDVDHDGVLTDEEIQAYRKGHPHGRRAAKAQAQ